MKTLEVNLELYAVMNSSGQFFRAKGYGGYGESWVSDINKAKIYARIGPARSIVTFYAKLDPTRIPQLIKIISSTVEVVDETERVNKIIKKAENDKIQADLRNKKRNLDDAQRKYNEAKNELDKAKKKLG